MIVIAIIAIIAAVAIPNLKDARMAAYESAAIATLRSYHSAQQVYREQDKDGNGTLDYADTNQRLVSAGLLDERFNSTIAYYQGYSHTLPANSRTTLFTWCRVSSPEKFGDSGSKYYFIDQTGVVRYSVSPSGSLLDWPAVGK